MATKIRNPFVHSHDHDHGHGHDHHHGNGHGHHDHDHHHDEQDPAQQSLADALRVSFALLKWVMVLLLVAYLFTGIFRVETAQRAVRLQFGKIMGEPGQQVYGPGWHLGLPYPIEQKILVPIGQRNIDVNQQFWFSAPPGSQGQTIDQMRGGPLNPERDGSLLTGDSNIVHGQFTVSYQISDEGVANYVQNVGNLQKADDIVRNVAEQAIVAAVAQAQADDLIRSNTEAVSAAAVRRMQEVLDEMETGVVVTTFTMPTSTMPLPVRGASQAVINAESEKASAIEAAKQKATSTLNETAGEAYDELFAMVRAYEQARGANDEAEAERLLGQIDAALDASEITTEQGLVRIGGRTAETINRAKTERTEIVQSVRAEANRFTQLLEQHRQSPGLVQTQLWERARGEIFTGDVETIYSPTGQGQTLTILTNKDPAIEREREKQRLQREQEEAQRRAQQNQPSP